MIVPSSGPIASEAMEAYRKMAGLKFIRMRAGIALTVLAILFIAGCFVYTEKVGHRMPYSGDDMMNLYHAWTMTPVQLLKANLTLAGGQRPMGAAFYRAQFAMWGFRSQPLHGVVWAVLALNLWLAWRLFRQLGAHAEASFLGVAILALHGGLRDLSFNAGTLYDTLCFTFYVAALIVYLRAHARGAADWRSLLLFALLFVCALNSKEMAVSLPLVVLLWELTFQPPESRSWRGVALGGAIAAIFCAIGSSTRETSAFAKRLRACAKRMPADSAHSSSGMYST